MGSWTKRADGAFTITWEDYQATHKDFKGTWTTPRPDIEGHSRDLMGRRSLMVYDKGTALAIEGRGLVIERAPRAHRLMLDKSGAGHYVLEFLDDAGEWVAMGWGLSEESAKDLLATSAKRDGRGNWAVTFKEQAGWG